MAKKYLDDSGLSYLWGKLKEIFQVKLVSGTNIKTINNNSLLGSGNITISGGGGSVTVDDALSTTSENPVQNKVITNNFGNYLPLTGGTLTGDLTTNGAVVEIEKSGTSVFFKSTRTDSNTAVSFGCGSSAGRHGLYSNSSNRWIIMYNGTDIYLGGADASNKVASWVVESGTANDWTYRKYSDGTFDAWGTFTKTPTSSTASGNIYYSNAISQNLPFTAVSGSVNVTGSVGAQYAWIVNTSSATTTVSFRIARGSAISTSTALTIKLQIHGSY